MEKLLLLLVFIAVLKTSLHSQNLVVFETNGEPTIDESGFVHRLQKGQNLATNATLTINKNDKVLVVSNEGILYKIEGPQTIIASKIEKDLKTVEETTFSKQYLNYIWNQLQSKSKIKNNNGNVFREGLPSNLLFPKDSLNLYDRKVTFKWKPNLKQNSTFFFLKDCTDNTLFKLEILGQEISLFVDNIILKKGVSYDWGVSKKQFPDFDTTPLNNFTILTDKDYEKQKSEVLRHNSTLNLQSFNEKEIKDFLCRFHNICRN